MARNLIDILREKEQFEGRGVPTTDYEGLGDDDVTEGVDLYLDSNDFSPRRPDIGHSGADEDASSVIRTIKRAAQGDPTLQALLDEIENMDDILFRELSKPYMGTAFTQGIQHNRYAPTGMGDQFPTNPAMADVSKLQFITDGGVEKVSLRTKANQHLREGVNNPPGGAEANQFRQGILSNNSNDGVNEVLDFYGQNEETRPSIGTAHKNEFTPQRRALDSGANLSKAMDTPNRDSFIKSALNDNRFKPTGFNGLTPETYLGNTEYSPSGQVPKPYSAEDLPFDDAELLSSDQSNRKYHVSPKSVGGKEGGLAKIGDARIDQINQDNQLVVKIGEERTLEEIRVSLSKGDELRKSIFQNGSDFGDKIATSPDEIQDLRYFDLEEDIDADYFSTLEQETGQFLNKETPGLRELSVSHLVYEMSKFQKGGPIPIDEGQSRNERIRDRGKGHEIGAGISGGLRQLGNRALQEARGELERVTGRSKEIARALMAPRGSSLRDVLKETEFTSGAFGANSKAKGEQSQDSPDAILARLRDTDNAMRRLFSSNKNDEAFSTLKDRYKEGFLVAGNFDRSYKEYENDFIGLAEDVQTLRDFFLKEGVERFYLSRNQTLISPFNNAKGRGMESFGIPSSKIDRQRLSNAPNAIGNVLGVDGERIINRGLDALGPIASIARQEVSLNQKSLILGRGPEQNLVGESNALKFMHGDLRTENARNSIFQSYINVDTNGNPSTVALLSKQLGRSEFMGVSKLPGSTLIDGNQIEILNSAASSVNMQEGYEDPESDSGGGSRSRLGSSIGQRIRGAASNRGAAFLSELGISGNRIRSNLNEGNVDVYNDPDQLEMAGGSYRISPAVVQAIEEGMDAQYMPFYFQDLRTNEILSFHAFLQDLRDSFNPDYNVKKFIGRVDPVVMYSGHTERQINVTFLTFATNPDDFQFLYEKVNRFIGFVYPQFNDGEEYRAEIGTGNDLKFKFTSGKTGRAHIPFSQKQKAGPLVRMRVGDIIKSRAFDDNPGLTPRISARAEEFLGIRDVLTVVNGKGQDEITRQSLNIESQSDAERVSQVNQDIQQALSKQGFTSVGGIEVSSIDFVNDRGELSLPKALLNESVDSISVGGDIYTASNEAELNEYYNLKLSEFDSIVNGAIANAQTTFTQDLLRVQELISTVNAINTGNAAIRKSFEAVGGRGLAGAISNLQIALLDEFPWEIQPGLKAPMGFKISFSFQALHDVAPGLDSKGEMRPVYAPKVQDGPIAVAGNEIAPVFDKTSALSITGNSNLASRAAEPPPRIRGPRSSTLSRRAAWGHIISSRVANVSISSAAGAYNETTGRTQSWATNQRGLDASDFDRYIIRAEIEWSGSDSYDFEINRAQRDAIWYDTLGENHGITITDFGDLRDVGDGVMRQVVEAAVAVERTGGTRAIGTAVDTGFREPRVGNRVAVSLVPASDQGRAMDVVDNIVNSF